jgi:hypothetical protein
MKGFASGASGSFRSGLRCTRTTSRPGGWAVEGGTTGSTTCERRTGTATFSAGTGRGTKTGVGSLSLLTI